MGIEDFAAAWGGASPEFDDVELTTKGRYAVMAMADLARQSDASAQPLPAIAERQGLPAAYLEQIFLSLRRAGLVESARGRSGGYRLARAASEISVNDVMAAVDEETRFTRCADDDARCSRDKPCVTHHLWTALGQTTSEFFARISLADVAGGAAISADVAKPAEARGASRVYLDHNATAPLRTAAREAMVAALDSVGNPSSVHADGRAARAIIEGARERVATLAGAKPSEVVFTSGATEANAWVMAQPWQTIFASGVEHDSVLATARASAADLVALTAGRDGRVRIEEIAERAAAGPRGRMLVSLQAANNETGVLQPLADGVAIAREHGLILHSDAVQALGRLPLDFGALGLDLMSVSAHKLGGPKGVGALVIRDRLDLAPLIRGGGQERRRRAGTENLAAIAGFGAAAEEALADLDQIARVASLRDRLESAVRASAPDAVIVGADAPRLANTTSFALPGRNAETLVIKFDLAGISVSAGAACSSGKVGASHVLEAMGYGPDVSRAAIRVSLGRETSERDVDAFIATFKTIVSQPALAA